MEKSTRALLQRCLLAVGRLWQSHFPSHRGECLRLDLMLDGFSSNYAAVVRIERSFSHPTTEVRLETDARQQGEQEQRREMA